MPLVVEYPIERKGVFHEMAYYTSGASGFVERGSHKGGTVLRQLDG